MIHHIQNQIDRIKVLSAIQDLKENVHWIVDIKRYRKKRTLSQNKLYWLWINCIAYETGNKPDDIHDYLKNRFLPKRKIKIFDEIKEVTMSTTELNTKQFTDYLNAIDADISTEGITLLYPDDLHWESFEQKYESFIG